MSRAAQQTPVTVAIVALLLFVPAGRLDWPMAWAFLLVFVAFCVVGLQVLDPALVAERGKLPIGGPRFDLVLASVFVALLYPVSFVVAGLDVRYGWSPALPLAIRVLALAVFAAGYGVALWAMRENIFFATVVRVQRERGHRVIDGGPYGFVRHPGYAGSILAHLALPIALGSLWAFLPSALGCLLLALRTIGEERVLERELDGYAEYKGRVRWRLAPGIW